MPIKNVKYVGDFETTTDPNDLRVWAYCLVDIETNKTASIGNNIDGFFNFLKNKNSKIWFHNLRFDAEFLLAFLLSSGYTYSDIPKDKTFSTLITNEGVFYSLTVIFEKIGKKKYRKAVFYDSLKKLPFKVSEISKAFGIKDRKLSIDYDAPRPVGHVLTEEEIAYIENDCKIVAQALKIQFDKGLVKMTNASDAMTWYKKTIKAINFDYWFPVLPVELDAQIRRAYKGGFTWLNPKYKDKHIYGGITLDVNSLYPWAYGTCLLPWGYPKFFEGKPVHDERYPLYIIRFKCSFKLKEGHIPCVQLKNNGRFCQTEYLTSSVDEMGVDEPVDLVMTSVDYELFKDHYDLWEEDYIAGWKFKGASGMFKEYLEYWMHIKETSKGPIKILSKLQLNSLYGRFAMSPKVRNKTPYLDRDGVVRYEDNKPELRDPVYTAVGAFITAYAREKTIRTGQKLYDRIIYSDTDSLHLLGTELPEDLEIHDTKLGAWAHEATWDNSYFIRAKTYMETIVGVKKDTLKEYCKLLNSVFTIEIYREADGIHYKERKVTCAGMPDNVKEKVFYDNFKTGSTFDGKLVPKRYKGGIVLTETTFTIK